MTHPPLAVFGYSEAAMFLRGAGRPDVAAVISICGRREFRVEADVPHRLDLSFDDVDAAPDPRRRGRAPAGSRPPAVGRAERVGGSSTGGAGRRRHHRVC